MKAQFLARMGILAEICRHRLDAYQMELYDRILAPWGYDRLCKMIDKCIISRKSNERFPSVADFVAMLPPRQTLNAGFPRLNEIHPSENSIFSREDIAEIFGMVRKRLRGEITCSELEEYGRMIQSAVDIGEKKRRA